jgi:hypothetical protein
MPTRQLLRDRNAPMVCLGRRHRGRGFVFALLSLAGVTLGVAQASSLFAGGRGAPRDPVNERVARRSRDRRTFESASRGGARVARAALRAGVLSLPCHCNGAGALGCRSSGGASLSRALVRRT